MATKTPTPTPAQPAAANPDAPYFGQGGSYSQDPATGVLTLIERAGQPASLAATPATQATPFTPVQE